MRTLAEAYTFGKKMVMYKGSKDQARTLCGNSFVFVSEWELYSAGSGKAV